MTRPEPTESAVLTAILRALKIHPAVACFWRQNTGAFAVGGKAGSLARPQALAGGIAGATGTV
jgi:hypothetical protein